METKTPGCFQCNSEGLSFLLLAVARLVVALDFSSLLRQGGHRQVFGRR